MNLPPQPDFEAGSLARSQPTATRQYLSGFGNEFATEALAGVLPQGQNSPQKAPLGLYAEQLSGSPFTAPRSYNRRSWLYKIWPSAMHGPYRRQDDGLWRSSFDELEGTPNRLRWNPLSIPEVPTDFIDGLITLAGCGSPQAASGCAALVYVANRSMTDRYLYDADAELLIVPQQGRLTLATELGVLELAPGEIAVVPRGVKFRVELPDGEARGYVCENFGAALRLPDLGPIGANGLANPRDFLTPVAAYEDSERPCQVYARFQGHLWACEYAHSPLDVVGWHGNYAPYKYDLARFNCIHSVSFDHPDPSIYTVLTSPTAVAGCANVDFVIFPPRWIVADHTFRPPWYHRNVMNEFMGLVHGVYDAKAEGFLPGGASLHNCMSAHGPDYTTYVKASTRTLVPEYLDQTLAFMFEASGVFRPTAFAMQSSALQGDYDACWDGFQREFRTPGAP